MKVKVSRIRYPLASFTGEIFVGDEKTATAEQIKLAFDYYPVLQADQKEQSSLEGSQKSEVEGSDLVHS